MPKQPNYGRGMGIGSVLSDRDWITIIGVLSKDRSAESQRLYKLLLTKSKQGRQVRILRVINDKRPTIPQMMRAVNMSRRSVFRYLTSLEAYGVRIGVDDSFRYFIERMPADLRKLL